MKKSIFIASMVLLAGIGLSFKSDTVNLKKITICHVPPGNPDNCHEITISLEAFETHFDHHDDRLICNDPAEASDYERLGNQHGMAVVYFYE
jgi:hypothetical protein